MLNSCKVFILLGNLDSSMTAKMARFCPPDQVFVDVLCGADVRINGVFVLTELPSETQVLEETKQKLSSLLSPNHVVVLRVLFLQHLEEQKKTPCQKKNKNR